MPDHLNERQLQGYRDRTLPLGEQMAVDAHISACKECRAALTADAGPVLAAIEQARFRHLSYEQMDDWVEDRLDQGARELVMAHIGLCAACARQLIAYQEYAPAMAAPIRTIQVAAAKAVTQKQSFWAFLKQPQYALGAAALLAFFIITPLTRHSAPPESSGAILAPAAADSKVPESAPLLDSERLAARDVPAASVAKPAALKGLESPEAGMLQYPYAEVVEETLPALKWKAFGDSYAVTLYDSRHNMIARRTGVTETQWTPTSALTRGAVYMWEVESGTQRYRATFKVLSEAQYKDLQNAREQHRGDPAAIGAVCEQFGLLAAARTEFEAAHAGDRVRQLDALRK